MALISTIASIFGIIGADIRAVKTRLTAVEAAQNSGTITTTINGDITMPFVGTVRRYFTAARDFVSMAIGVSVAPSANVTAEILKNDIVVATLVLAASETYFQGAVEFSVVAGDYLTVNLSGGNTSDVTIVLE